VQEDILGILKIFQNC